MYVQQSLQDNLFLMLYGAIAILALATGLYLWLRRSNTIAPDVTPPKALRLCTAAFFITAALSHIWWYVLGIYWLTDDRLVRNIVAVTLDHITLVPLVMAFLLRMLQDRQRPLWPWVLSQAQVETLAIIVFLSWRVETLQQLRCSLQAVQRPNRCLVDEESITSSKSNFLFK